MVTTDAQSAQFAVIPGLGSARSLVYATWLRSYQVSSDLARHVPKDIFFANHHKVIDRILARPDAEVRLAVWTDDPNVVFGWSVTEPGCAHYVYVKPDFRRLGIARALLAHLAPGYLASHYTHKLRDISDDLVPPYNPYLALGVQE